MLKNRILALPYSKFHPHIEKYEQCVYIDWHTNSTCNYKCFYCAVVNGGGEPARPSPDVVVDCFNALGRTLIVNMCGGESFLYPGFVRLCAGLTHSHYIAINTNLSTSNVYEFGRVIDPLRVLFITASLHVTEREKFPERFLEFVKKVVYLQKLGFPIVVAYVAHPILLARMRDDIDRLRSAGVKHVEIGVFQGLYRNCRYPAAYTLSERQFLAEFRLDCDDKAVLEDTHGFKGCRCMAGVRSFSLHSDGRFYRCNRSFRQYGGLYSRKLRPDAEPRPCPFTRCCVPSFGIFSVQSEHVRHASCYEALKEVMAAGVHRIKSTLTNPGGALLKVRTRFVQRLQ